MNSREKERIALEKPVQCQGGVENWLNSLLQMHQVSVGTTISQGLQVLANPDIDLIAFIDQQVLQVNNPVMNKIRFKKICVK